MMGVFWYIVACTGGFCTTLTTEKDFGSCMNRAVAMQHYNDERKGGYSLWCVKTTNNI